MHKIIVQRCLIIVFGMLLFAIAMVPLYNVFCDVTGINGKIKLQPLQGKYLSYTPDMNRKININFDVNKNGNVNLKFHPKTHKKTLSPGEIFKVTYAATNPNSNEIIVHAIPSITPGKAAKHLKKIDCFCFNQLIIPAKTTVDMSLEFYLDNSLDEEIKDITLSYTLFDVTYTNYTIN